MMKGVFPSLILTNGPYFLVKPSFIALWRVFERGFVFVTSQKILVMTLCILPAVNFSVNDRKQLQFNFNSLPSSIQFYVPFSLWCNLKTGHPSCKKKPSSHNLKNEHETFVQSGLD